MFFKDGDHNSGYLIIIKHYFWSNLETSSCIGEKIKNEHYQNDDKSRVNSFLDFSRGSCLKDQVILGQQRSLLLILG
jgi:hypothetical protein